MCVYLVTVDTKWLVIFSNSLQTLTVRFYMMKNEKILAKPLYFGF